MQLIEPQSSKNTPIRACALAVYDRVLENTQITTNIIEPSNSNIRPNRASDKDLNTVLSYLDQAKRPMIYAGDGIWKSGGELSASKLATYFGAAVVTTILTTEEFLSNIPTYG
ncbi:MAG: hypothetical protein CM1200mP38_2380 [Dehalococcoidia bacterium]|nr:MAG: hypothetical protein CM1200mP38_2380 [Dehalococcoidia bacterium]